MQLSRCKMDRSVVDALRRFEHASKFRRACLSVMAWSLTHEERKSVVDAFLELDTSRRGTIRLHELRDVLQRFDIPDQESAEIFHALDGGQCDEVHYSEFLGAMVSSRIAMHDQMLRAAFARFDVDGKGFISRESLTKLLGEGAAEVDELLQEVDPKATGKVSYEQFVAYLRSGNAQEEHMDVVNQMLAQGGKAKECLAAAQTQKKSVEEILAASKDRWLRRLKMGFNLLIEGFGSKWRLLEAFVQDLQSHDLDVCCIDGFDATASVPNFLHQLLAQLFGHHRGIGSLEALVQAVLEAQAQDSVPLVLVVHNLEALPVAHQAALSTLVAGHGIWLVTSVDHLWAPLAWSSDMLKDFNFCREEVHTMEGYEIELQGKYPEGPPNWVDPFAVEVSSKVSMGLVLKSLTSNHRELVEVMAKNQLEGRKEGISMPDLLVVAEDRMIANNLTKLRRLLNELTDHDIVVQRQGQDGTTVYALVAKEQLLRRLALADSPGFCIDHGSTRGGLGCGRAGRRSRDLRGPQHFGCTPPPHSSGTACCELRNISREQQPLWHLLRCGRCCFAGSRSCCDQTCGEQGAHY